MTLSATERIANLEAVAKEFGHQLIHTPGIALSSHQRLWVAKCARHGLFCKACGTIEQETCFRTGATFETIQKLKHCDNDDATSCHDEDSVVAITKEFASVVTCFVHTIVNFQTKVDPTWYEQTMAALDGLQLFPPEANEEPLSPSSLSRHKSLLLSLYGEILGITVVSHGIHVAFLAMKENVPMLPRSSSIQTDLAPTLVDLTGLLKNGGKIHYMEEDPLEGFVPVFHGTMDLDKDLLERTFSKEVAHFYDTSMIRAVPFRGLSFAPNEVYMVSCLFLDEYLYNAETTIFKPYIGLDPSKHCSDQFSRYDTEQVFVGVVTKYDCHF